jgi:RHS repeat-associated protein
VTHRYDYDPFGRQLTASGTLTNPLRFAGRELDATAGLYYVRARWYDPVLGRFISEDPIGLGGGINTYAYALNDPVNLSDPTGLCVGEKYNVNTTVCVLDPISSVAPPWYRSMIDEVFGLGGRQSAFAGMTFGGHNDDGSGPGMWEEVKAWNECVASTSSENFIATHQGMASLPSQVAKKVAGLGLGMWAAKKLGDSGLLGDAWRWSRGAPQRGLLNAGTRVWVSQIGGRTVYGMGSALVRAAQKSVVTTLSFETGIALGSILVALTECSF